MTMGRIRASPPLDAPHTSTDAGRARPAVASRRATTLLAADRLEGCELLGVRHTWLLAQARERQIPHHRLGHYVRFSAEDLARWLAETRVERGSAPPRRPSAGR